MADFFSHLVEQSRGIYPGVQPLITPLFAPAATLPGAEEAPATATLPDVFDVRGDEFRGPALPPDLVPEEARHATLPMPLLRDFQARDEEQSAGDIEPLAEIEAETAPQEPTAETPVAEGLRAHSDGPRQRLVAEDQQNASKPTAAEPPDVPTKPTSQRRESGSVAATNMPAPRPSAMEVGNVEEAAGTISPTQPDAVEQARKATTSGDRQQQSRRDEGVASPEQSTSDGALNSPRSKQSPASAPGNTTVSPVHPVLDATQRPGSVSPALQISEPTQRMAAFGSPTSHPLSDAAPEQDDEITNQDADRQSSAPTQTQKMRATPIQPIIASEQPAEPASRASADAQAPEQRTEQSGQMQRQQRSRNVEGNRTQDHAYEPAHSDHPTRQGDGRVAGKGNRAQGRASEPAAHNSEATRRSEDRTDAKSNAAQSQTHKQTERGAIRPLSSEARPAIREDEGAAQTLKGGSQPGRTYRGQVSSEGKLSPAQKASPDQGKSSTARSLEANAPGDAAAQHEGTAAASAAQKPQREPDQGITPLLPPEQETRSNRTAVEGRRERHNRGASSAAGAGEEGQESPKETLPDIRVRIGRIDVRATSPVTPPAPKRSGPTRPTLTLSEYLERRRKGEQ